MCSDCYSFGSMQAAQKETKAPTIPGNVLSHDAARQRLKAGHACCVARTSGRDAGAAVRVAICALLLAAAFVSPSRAQQASAPVPVGVVKAERKPITLSLDFVGRVDAINRVDIQARVTGFLEAVLFKEGDAISEAAPLYRIEKGLFQAAVEQAEGALERSKAAKVLSALQLQRAQELLDKNVGTVVARDQQKAADDQAAGAVLSDDSALATAKINLGYTDITSPIAGKISKTNVTKGNLVSPGSGTLTTIVSQDPMYVTFPVSQRDFLKARETKTKVDLSALRASLRFADGTIYDQPGRINFVDVTVDRATDTVLVRATFPNPASSLIDGQFVRVRVDLESGSVKEQVVVPQAALIADQEGVYVFVVEDGKAVVKRVKPTGGTGTDVALESGLNGGEEVIVQGLQSVRPGAPVRATPLQPALNQGG
ncbi:efflux RND transporter periplasmic adaptor subunit [Bradyrhizobium erythrophlei]|uniref:Membrane fusion protein, multidrug efflux system n=1 Tax=Bradyrhizobium erythrophlei TaxID=1437360 RepID=A0A1M7UIQ4_9BRAD|nr:efflux RND transporter periplasmic adaptor subunit [Bradyrhizobium erythrophlei]SHN82806.1 membrane fusion protein, multidrug efflux system [Bradyrhizobium erythrophlei]